MFTVGGYKIYMTTNTNMLVEDKQETITTHEFA